MNFRLTNFCEIDKFAIESYSRIHDVNPDLNLGDVSMVNTDIFLVYSDKISKKYVEKNQCGMKALYRRIYIIYP